MLLVVGGMIGGGKSSLTEIVADRFGGHAFYEDTTSPVLEKFYTASEEDQEKYRYAFLLQLHFLDTRFRDIKRCLTVGDNPQVNCLDRSIYEDWYFAYVNMKRGRISELEFKLYESIVNNMMEELKELPKKAPDLMLYLKGSFETFLKRIQKRSRGFELDKDTEEYFYQLWKGYDDWVFENYKASEVLVIDIDRYDFVESLDDREEVLSMIEEKLIEMELLPAPDLTLKVGDKVTLRSDLKAGKFYGLITWLEDMEHSGELTVSQVFPEDNVFTTVEKSYYYSFEMIDRKG